jgi:hypothetical protein
MEQESLYNFKTILIDFSIISGLKCNLEKTVVMHIGLTVTAPDFMDNLGFTLVDSVTILGFKISNTGLQVESMFDDVYAKIGRIITMWDRFRLSLPGRLNISKTLLISQISYIGSICTPPPHLLKNIQELLNNFVKGNIKVGKDRLYSSPASGGVGLINISHFLIGLQAVWVKRAHESTRDNWRVDLHNKCSGTC